MRHRTLQMPRALSVTLISAIGLSVGACGADWRVFKSDDGFSVALPSEPQIGGGPGGSTDSGSLKWLAARSSPDVLKAHGSATYMVGVSAVMPAEMVSAAAERAKQLIMEGSEGAKLVHETRIDSGLFKGVRLELRSDEFLVLAEVRDYGRRTIALVSMGPENVVRSNNEKFFGSLVVQTTPIQE